MKSVIRATVTLGGSAAATAIAGAASAKLWSYFLGPSGYGLLSLEQSLLKIATLAGTVGVGTALVRHAAQAVAEGRFDQARRQERAANLLSVLFAVAAVVIFFQFRHAVNQWLLGATGPDWATPVVGVALACNIVFDLQTGILNAHHQIKAIAVSAVLGAVAGAGIGVAIVALWGQSGVPFAVLALPVTNCAAAAWWVHRTVPQRGATQGLRPAWGDCVALLRFGGLYTVSMLAGTGAQLALPFLVLHMLGTADVGYYRAAMLITVSYLGFLLNALGRDYFPRLAAASDRTDQLVFLINEQHRIVLTLAMPVILAMIALAPVLVPILYTPLFVPAIAVLEWQLLGDIFKLASWTMSFAILACCPSHFFLWTELGGGVAVVIASWVGLRLDGLDGIGIAYAAAYVVYYLVVRVGVRRRIPLVWTRANRRRMGLGVAAAVFLRLLPGTAWAAWRTPMALALAALFAVPALRLIAAEYGRSRSLLRDLA